MPAFVSSIFILELLLPIAPASSLIKILAVRIPKISQRDFVEEQPVTLAGMKRAVTRPAGRILDPSSGTSGLDPFLASTKRALRRLRPTKTPEDVSSLSLLLSRDLKRLAKLLACIKPRWPLAAALYRRGL